MECWHCQRTATGVCRFCGRAVCADHVEIRPFILALHPGTESVQALVVEDALSCGACNPRPDLVDLPGL
jgi:hypothetical protein